MYVEDLRTECLQDIYTAALEGKCSDRVAVCDVTFAWHSVLRRKHLHGEL